MFNRDAGFILRYAPSPNWAGIVHNAAGPTNTRLETGDWAASPPFTSNALILGRTSDGTGYIKWMVDGFGGIQGLRLYGVDGWLINLFSFPQTTFSVSVLAVENDMVYLYDATNSAWRILDLFGGQWSTFTPTGMPAFSTISGGAPRAMVDGGQMFIMGHVYVGPSAYNPVFVVMDMTTFEVTTLLTVSTIGSAWNQKPISTGYGRVEDFTVDASTNTAYVVSNTHDSGGTARVYVIPLGGGVGGVIETDDMGAPSNLQTPILLEVSGQKYLYAVNSNAAVRAVLRKSLQSPFGVSVVDVGESTPLPGTNFYLFPFLVNAAPPVTECFWTDLVGVKQTGCG